MAKKKLTPNQQEYKKQIKRIKAAIRREKKKGFNTIKLEVELLNKPSRITQKFLDTLRSITPKFIRKRSEKYIEIPVQPVQTEPQKFSMPEPTQQYTYEPSPTEDTSEYQYDDYGYDYEPTPNISEAFESLAKGLEELPKSEQTIEEPSPVTEPEPQSFLDQYEEADQYQYYGDTNEYVIYDANHEELTRLIGTDSGYVDVNTGEIVANNRIELVGIVKDLNPTYMQRVGIDISEYAVSRIFEDTKWLDKRLDGALHELYREIINRIGVQGFYKNLVEENEHKSIFKELQAMLDSGAEYFEAITKYGASVLSALPLTEEERTSISDAFSDRLEVALEVDTER